MLPKESLREKVQAKTGTCETLWYSCVLSLIPNCSNTPSDKAYNAPCQSCGEALGRASIAIDHRCQSTDTTSFKQQLKSLRASLYIELDTELHWRKTRTKRRASPDIINCASIARPVPGLSGASVDSHGSTSFDVEPMGGNFGLHAAFDEGSVIQGNQFPAPMWFDNFFLPPSNPAPPTY